MSPPDAARPPHTARAGDASGAAKQADDGPKVIPRGHRGGRTTGRTRWSKMFGPPPERIGSRFLVSKADIEAYGFAQRQLERGLAEGTLRRGGINRPALACVLGVSPGQIAHVFAARRHFSVEKQVQLGRALQELSLAEWRAEGGGRWEDVADDDLADDDFDPDFDPWYEDEDGAQ